MRLRCSRLSVAFDTPAGVVQAIHDLSFETRDGEFLTIIGPSGCGKTTLLRAIAGLLEPQEGTIERSTLNVNEQALMVFQEDSLFPWMTVLENAAFGLEAQGFDRGSREAAATDFLDRVGLKGRGQDYPHQLSVGMKKRVAVIRSFLCKPPMLLMDEPFAALDAQTRLRLHQELLALWEADRRNILFVTHDIEEALLLSDRILVLSTGPGTVVSEFKVPFPRPRAPRTVLREDFIQLKARLLAQLGFTAEAGKQG